MIMKGSVEELLYLVASFISVFFMVVFLNYQLSIGGREVRKNVEERLIDENGLNVLKGLFDTKLPIIEKSHLEVCIDALLQSENKNKELSKVFYGAQLGTTYCNEILKNYFNNYLGEIWRLELIANEVKYSYGSENYDKNLIYSFSFVVPVPEEKVGRVTFYILKPK
ncbi:MAG: hypothetical protein QXD89_00580 [Candidatus Aenigmatarchaeota archaeon]